MVAWLIRIDQFDGMTLRPSQAGLAALARGDTAAARSLLEQGAAEGDVSAPVWLALAQLRGRAGDSAGELAAFDRVLELEPRNLAALLGKGEALWRANNRRRAVTFYTAALRLASASRNIHPDLSPALRRASAASEELARELENHILGRLNDQGFSRGGSPPRFVHALDLMLGKRRIYPQTPRYFYFPELAPIEFFDRSDFPWAAEVERSTQAILDELKSVTQGGAPSFVPYVPEDNNRPERRQAGLAGNKAWSAFFLKKDGVLQPGAETCPRTWEAVREAPLTEIPGRAPSVLFSKLSPGARIPPHTGMINVRLICHLPLIVPEGCALRVGNETRNWGVGELMIFDDTIEHEAWNSGDRDRYVLLFDVWRPDLSDDERASVIALCSAIDSFEEGQSEAWDA